MDQMKSSPARRTVMAERCWPFDTFSRMAQQIQATVQRAATGDGGIHLKTKSSPHPIVATNWRTSLKPRLKARKGFVDFSLLSMKALLINTPLQRRDWRRSETRNRFNGFAAVWKTVETVFSNRITPGTPLKRGVNENSRSFQVFTFNNSSAYGPQHKL